LPRSEPPDDAVPRFALPLPASDPGPAESGFEPDGCRAPPPLDEPARGVSAGGVSVPPDPDEPGEPDEPEPERAGAGSAGETDSTAAPSAGPLAAEPPPRAAGAAETTGAAVAAGAAAAAAGTAASAAHFALPSPFPEPHESATATPDDNTPNTAATSTTPTHGPPGHQRSRREPAPPRTAIPKRRLRIPASVGRAARTTADLTPRERAKTEAPTNPQ
jgi:hypothetical protein